MKLVHVVVEPIGPGLGGGARYPSALLTGLQEAGIEQRVLLASQQRGLHYDDITPDADGPGLADWVDRSTWCLVHSPDTQALAVASTLRGRHPGARIAAIDYGGMTLMPRERLLPRRYRYREIEVCFAISEYSRRRLNLPRARTSVVYGGGDHILRVRAQGVLTPVDFTYIGRALPHKGLDRLLDGLPDGAALRCIGPSSTWSSTQYGQRVAERVRATGGDVVSDLSDGHLRAALEATRWLVLPSIDRVGLRKLRRSELLGLVLLEAAAVGTPSIVSTAGALPEVARLIGGRVCSGQRASDWRSELAAALAEEATPVSLPESLTWRNVAARVIDRLA